MCRPMNCCAVLFSDLHVKETHLYQKEDQIGVCTSTYFQPIFMFSVRW